MSQIRLKLSPELRSGNKSFWLSLTFHKEPRPRKNNVINFEIDVWEGNRISNKSNVKVDLIEGKRLLKDLIEQEKEIEIAELGFSAKIKQPENVSGKIIEITIGKLSFSYSWTKFMVWGLEILNFLEVALEEYYKSIYQLVSEVSENEQKFQEAFEEGIS